MRISQLADPVLLRRFRNGLSWRVGPFVVCVQTSLASVARDLAFLYHDAPLADDEIADAHVSVVVEGLFRRHASIFVDGRSLYRSLPVDRTVPWIEWTLNLCVFHRPGRFLTIHGAVVEKCGRVALIPGEAGIGKSTLCAALVQRGWRLFSDEVALVRPEDGWVVPAPRPVSLKEDSIELMAEFAPDAEFGPIWPGTAKGRLVHMLPGRDSIHRMDEPAPPAWIVNPNFKPGADAELTSVPKAPAFMLCAGNAFNYDILGARGFHVLAQLIDVCECYELTYGDLEQATAQFDSLAAELVSGIPRVESVG